MKDEYFAMMTSQLRSWDARFGILTEDARPAATDARYDGRIKAMRADRDVAHRQLQEIRKASESAWRGMQSGMDDAWISIKRALDAAVVEAGKRR